LWHDNIAIIAPSKTLASKFLGSFPVVSKISDLVYRLKLPKSLQIHDIFHVSLLEKYHKDTIIGCRPQPPPLVIIPKGDIKWEVKNILDSKRIGHWRKLQYLVEWEGYGPEQNSWEPMENLKNAPDAVRQFHKFHPVAVG